MKNNKLKIGIIVGVCAVIAFVCIGTIITLNQGSYAVGTIANGVGTEVNTMGQGSTTEKTDSAYTYNNNANNNRYTYTEPPQQDNVYPKEDTQYVDSHNAAMTVKTNDINKTYNDFCQSATEAGAEIYQHYYYYEDEKGTGYATVFMLVPNEKYENVLTLARAAGTVISEDTSIKKVEVPEETSSSSASSSPKQISSNYYYYGDNQYDMSKYSELAIAFNDDEPNFIQLNDLKNVAMVATNIFLGLVLFLIPVAVAIAIIVLIVKAIKKSNAKKEQVEAKTTVNTTESKNFTHTNNE